MMIGGHIRSARMGIDGKPTLPKGMWKRVIRFARPHWPKIIVYLVTVSLVAAVPLAQPWLLGRFVDLLSPIEAARRGGKPIVVPADIKHTFLLIVIGFAAIPILSSGVGLINRWFSSLVGEGLIFDLRTALFSRVQRMPIAFFTRTQTGALISRLNNDVVGAQSALTGTLGGILQNTIQVILTLAIMASISWRMTILSLVATPLFVLPARSMGKKVGALSREQMDLNASMNATMTERFNVSGALLVKLFGRKRDEQDNFSSRAGRVRDIGIRISVLFRTYAMILGAVGATAAALVYWFGGTQVLRGSLSLGEVVSFGAYVTQIYGPITALVNARVDIITAFVSFDRVFEILDLPQIVEEKPDAGNLPDPKGHVTFDNVSFRYPTSDEVPIGSLSGKSETPATGERALRNVSFDIPPGKMVALVGPSGGGKSTISSLVPRLYDVTEGLVTFDGIDVRDLKLEALAGAIGMVTQDAHLFHESLRDNLMYARPEATETELIEACKAAQIHDLISSLPDGYDTVVGERGYRLSGGEKARVAIARVLLKDPAVLVLDEATAHLDSTSEVLIQKALAIALRGRSSLVIAHRLSTIVMADEILVIEKGEITERGHHSELIEADGPYARLYRTQFSSAV